MNRHDGKDTENVKWLCNKSTKWVDKVTAEISTLFRFQSVGTFLDHPV